jgi:LPPG:FO 2-phospho-L-lactate transferase
VPGMFRQRDPEVVALAGGVGGARLAYGLYQLLPPERLTIVVNTADDFMLHGLHISPDLDAVMYTLAGLANPLTGWGVAGDTWEALGMLERYGAEVWFRLGDRDLATHIHRTALLRAGYTLSQVTASLAEALGVRCALLPMSDDPVATMIQTDGGELPFQDYFVRLQWQPVMRGVRFQGVEQAAPTPQVLAALEAADAIVICPSNPFVSIDPILALPGLRDALLAVPAPRVAVSPIVGGKAVKGPAAKMMQELGLEVSPVSVAAHYAPLLSGFIADVADQEEMTGFHARVQVPCEWVDTIMHTTADMVRLAGVVLGLANKLSLEPWQRVAA